jgi:hypothetical protein
MSKVNLKDYKKENRGLLRKSVEERVTYKKSGPKPKPEDEKKLCQNPRFYEACRT